MVNISIAVAMTDVFDIFVECGAHTNGNYPHVGGCDIEFPVDVERYESMRSSFRKNQPRERYALESYKHLVVNKGVEEDGSIISEVIEALKADKLVNGLIWASAEFDRHVSFSVTSKTNFLVVL